MLGILQRHQFPCLDKLIYVVNVYYRLLHFMSFLT